MKTKIFFAFLMVALVNGHAQNRRSNPIVSHMFTADPSAHVWEDGRLYVYPSTDNAPPRGYKTMDGYHVFSTDDMINWKDHGEILHSSQVEWGRKEGGFMWAPDCAYKNGVYYYYFPHPTGTDFKNTWKIGVATSTKPASDFKVQGYIKDIPSLIDPCVFIDDDHQGYLYIAGNDECYGVKLKENMMEIDGELIKQTGLDGLREGPFVFKRNDIYYLIYPDDFPKFNKMRYAMSKSPLGPWENNEVFLNSTDVITTHGSVVEYKGQWYLFYHNGNLSGGIGPNRSICFDPIYFNEDGTIQMVKQTLGVQSPTFHKDFNFNGMMGTLSLGDYNQADLEKQGIQPNDISSIEIPKGYKVEGFEKDNFKGKSWVFEENRINLNDIGCNDVIKSLKISKFKDENLVKNGSFELATEEQLKNWGSRRSSQLYKRTLNNSANGYYVMCYTGNGEAQPITQSIELTPNTNYELSMKLKVDSGTHGKVIFDTKGSFDEACKFELDSNTKADKWVNFKGVFNSGDASKIELRCLTSDDFKGNAYWDDVVLKEFQAQGKESEVQSLKNSDGSSFKPKDFFPKFSWDTTPLYFMFQHKKRLLLLEEVEFIAARTDFLCIEKSHGKEELGAAELGAKHEAAAFKKMKPDAKVLFYFNSAYAWPYTSYSENFTNESIENYPELKQFLLTNPKTGKLYEHYGAFCFDVLNPDFREWWVDTVVKGVKESGCDGVFIDQMHGNSRFRKEKKPEIEVSMGEMMTALKNKMGSDKILLGNNANNDDAKYAYPFCDAVMFENYATARSSKESLLNEWSDMLRNAQKGKISVFRLGVEGAGRGNLKPANEMPKYSQEKLEFALACYLIGAQPYSYFMYSWGWKLSTGPLVNYPELQKPLGAPKGAYERTTLTGWEFTREFEHASVWVDTDGRKAKITWH